MSSIKHTENLVTPNISHFTSADYEDIYEPAEDSFLFLDVLEKDMPLIRSLQPSVCLEIGSGSGIVSTCLSNALSSTTFVMSTDINPKACAATRDTAWKNNTHVESVQMDLASMFRQNRVVDILLFNPPYVVTDSEEVVKPFESSGSLLHRAWAGGILGREVTDRLLPCVSELLAPKSIFYLVVIKENNPESIAAYMSKQGFHHEIVMSRKVRGENLSVMRFQRGI